MNRAAETLFDGLLT